MHVNDGESVDCALATVTIAKATANVHTKVEKCAVGEKIHMFVSKGGKVKSGH